MDQESNNLTINKASLHFTTNYHQYYFHLSNNSSKHNQTIYDQIHYYDILIVKLILFHIVISFILLFHPKI